MTPDGGPVTIYGVTMVRDEADVIETTLRHMATQVDHIIVADNLSTDGTAEIVHRLAKTLPITVVADTDPGYWQADKMTRLSLDAMNAGADWVLPFDADELFCGRNGLTVKAELEALPAHIDTVYAAGWDHIARDDSGALSPWRRSHTQPLPKVAFRPGPDRRLAMGNHDVTGGNGRAAEALTFRHFQYRTLEQMARKVRQGAAAYAATDLAETFGSHWRQAATLSDEDLAERWAALNDEPGLVFDPPPIFGRRLSVSVVVPAWNLHDLTAQCVESVGATCGAEVVVVDNGSEPPYEAAAVRNDENRGFAVASNQGAAVASGDLLVFLNNDTVCTPGWLDAMVARWSGDDVVVGAHLTYPDGGTQHSGVFFRRDAAGRLEAFNRTQPAGSGEVPAVTGACLLISRKRFAELGGFDEGFRNAYEDVDLLLKHRREGGRVWFESSSVVVHLESRTPGRFDHVAHNVSLLQERWGDLPI